MIHAAYLLSRFVVALLLLGSVVSCSSVSKGPGGRITKVKAYHLQPTEPLRTIDPSLLFERNHYLHGATTLAEQMERAGHYYNVWWKANDRSQPVTLRFEYRQKDSGLTVKTKDFQITEVRGSNQTKFNVIGADYQSNGAVTAWRITLRRGKEVLASQQSFLWN
jgi:hypothetical protein